MTTRRKKNRCDNELSLTITFLDSLEKAGRHQAALWYAEQARRALGRDKKRQTVLLRRIETLKRRGRRKIRRAR